MKSFVVFFALMACAAAANVNRDKRSFLGGIHSVDSLSLGYSGLYSAPVIAPAAKVVTVNKLVHSARVVDVPQVVNVRKVVSVPQVVSVHKVVAAPSYSYGSLGYGYGSVYGSGYSSSLW